MKRKRTFKEGEPTLKVCPYGQWECKREPGQDCPLTLSLRTIKDQVTWAMEAQSAMFCQHEGQALTKKQYNARKQGMVV